MKRVSTGALFALLLLLGCGKEERGIFKASAIIEGTSVKVSAQIGGYLRQVYLDEGDEVEAGQTIAVVDTETIGYQLDQVLASLEELEAQRRIAEANLTRARKDYEYAKTNYERLQSLFATNTVSEQALDDLRVAHDRAQVALEAAKLKLTSISSKEKALRAQVKLLRKQMGDAVVKAPMAGTIATRYYHSGETVPMYAPLVEIIDLSEMWAKVYVSESFLPRIKIGQSAEVKIDGTDRTLVGTVVWISPKAEFTPKNILTEESRTALVYAVKIVVENRDRILKHGMPVSIALRLSS
jgi:HlyD family secretion protein